MSDKMTTSKIQIKFVRSFSAGFAVHSPTLNGLSVEIYLGFFHLALWSRGKKLFGFNNYWGG